MAINHLMLTDSQFACTEVIVLYHQTVSTAGTTCRHAALVHFKTEQYGGILNYIFKTYKKHYENKLK